MASVTGFHGQSTPESRRGSNDENDLHRKPFVGASRLHFNPEKGRIQNLRQTPNTCRKDYGFLLS